MRIDKRCYWNKIQFEEQLTLLMAFSGKAQLEKVRLMFSPSIYFSSVQKVILSTDPIFSILFLGPRWASWNIGVFLCIRCAGIHRNLGVHISKVKSVNLDSWTPEQVVVSECLFPINHFVSM